MVAHRIETTCDLLQQILAFRDERDWKQFHSPSNLAAALSVEAGELLEHFLWDRDKQIDTGAVGDELADVLVYALLLAHELDLAVETIISNKLEKNRAKYPVDKAKGNARKYTDLD